MSVFNVGRIIVTSNNPAWAERLGGKFSEWLANEKWEHAVSVVKTAKPRRRGEAPRVQIVFKPGEYQSNGERKFAYKLLPNFELLEAKLKTWLHEVE